MAQRGFHPFFLPGDTTPWIPQVTAEHSVAPSVANLAIFNPFTQNGLPVQNNALPFGSPLYHLNYGAVIRPEVHISQEVLQSIDGVVCKCWNDLLATGETVSACKVSKATLLMMQSDSWESLGLYMHLIPSIQCLMLKEAKINAFIHCFLGVRRIATLHELEVTICKNEGVQQFEQLQLGPLVRHPLIMHYFSFGPDLDGSLKISSEEIISYLCELIDIRKEKRVDAKRLLNFIAKKHSITCKEKLGVRIQDLGMHVTYIREAMDCEGVMIKKVCLSFKNRVTQPTSRKKRRLFPSLKRHLTDRFKAISDRVESFSSAQQKFCGKHIRFDLLSSDDGKENDPSVTSDKMDIEGCNTPNSMLSPTTETSEKLSSCPYPSAAEEMTRLGLATGTGSVPFTSDISRYYGTSSVTGRRSRCLISSRMLKRRKLDVSNSEGSSTVKYNFSLREDSQKMFISTWKEACRELDVAEILESMIQVCNPSKKKANLIRSIFASPPFMGLLNIAVKSMKCGMWDNIYDAFNEIIDSEVTERKDVAVEDIDVGNAEKTNLFVNHDSLTPTLNISPSDVINKLAEYFELDIEHCEDSIVKKKFMVLKKLCNCESWLVEQFSVSNFNSLGFGDFFTFIENYSYILPGPLHGYLKPAVENFPLEVSMCERQLSVLLSQALCGLCDDENIVNKEWVATLLMRQFPSVCFKVMEYVSLENMLNEMNLHKNRSILSQVIFSQTLSGISNTSKPRHKKNNTHSHLPRAEETTKLDILSLTPVTSELAMGTLLKAPMLSDISAWSHWELIFAPHLGLLVEWLLNKVGGNKISCLMTRDGNMIRIDESATVDSFFEALLQGCPYLTAVKLLSLFSLYGGKNYIPLSLLKNHSHRAFDAILKGSSNDDQNSVLNFHSHSFAPCKLLEDSLFSSSNGNSCEGFRKVNEGVVAASRFILDCLRYLPSEFHSFAADVLLSGLRSVVKDAASIILRECDNMHQRVMLHESGISLGIIEWISDYNSFCSSIVPDTPVCPREAKSGITFASESGELKTLVTLEKVSEPTDTLTHSCNDAPLDTWHFSFHDSSGHDENNAGHVEINAVSIIESIRREEFGLSSNIPFFEGNMLRKQHDRLGRALHCLSQELYSQDSHFILELVQNADDNIYPGNVEPTLTFILQEKSIVVLNNERGFSAHNIRALCDVGNSTKKGSAGYIGNKGIGFKSVFRVTDAPEIHSNGFHVKFDISGGQIGFVLPTIIPPCDLKLFRRLASVDEEPDFCSTCIVLPFKSKLSGDFEISSVISMFSDLQPSLLLFLHRLRCIKLRNVMNDSLIVMRKETLGDGIVTVSCGKEKMTWLVVSQELHGNAVRPDVKMTEIALAFTLSEIDGRYAPCLKQQAVFAFLPLRTYGLKFIIQGDFILTSSREEVDGDSSWNQWLLSEFPGLFVRAGISFCALPCFKDDRAKAVTVFMSFVPLLGEVHGFFSALPRMIISRLCMSDCLLIEGEEKWVSPRKVLRNWNEQARSVLPDKMLHDHLGLAFLDKDIALSPSLASALGVEDYGPKILIQVMSSLCVSEAALDSVGLVWICHWLNSLYAMHLYSESQSSVVGMGLELITDLRQLPFIPLLDGTYGSVNGGTIWLHSDGCTHESAAFPSLYGKLRIVNPALLSSAAAHAETSLDENVSRMLLIIGTQKLNAHDILKVHVLPVLSGFDPAQGDDDLTVEFLCFAMYHLQSDCSVCIVEKDFLVSQLRKATILTTHGYKRLVEASIHFGKEYGNPVDMDRLIGADVMWYEIAAAYLKHPVTQLLPCGMVKWRDFLKTLGVNDFVRVVETEKNMTDFTPDAKNESVILPCDYLVDWESEELDALLSSPSLICDRGKCSYLLEVLDILWDEYFADKVTAKFSVKRGEAAGFLRSSFITRICDIKWVTSSYDLNLYRSSDLFHDCDEVSSVLGVYASYARPKVKNYRLLADIGFKTRVTIDDALGMFDIWRRAEKPLMASIAQMSRFYTFIRNEMGPSRDKIMSALSSGPCVFVPHGIASGNDAAVAGVLLSPGEVCWRDTVVPTDSVPCLVNRELHATYPAVLRDFFVADCGVTESLSFRCTLQFLLELSSSRLPSQSASSVFQVFCKWADDLEGEDIRELKESLRKSECRILPTELDKWVSLHPSFGLICWCDDPDLGKEFRPKNGIHFLSFDGVAARPNVPAFFQALGIPRLSQTVTREAVVSNGSSDPAASKSSLVNWALPHAQRYMHALHPDRYASSRLSGVTDGLRVSSVEKLFYRNAVAGRASDKRHPCSSLLHGTVLYTTPDSDAHALFLELSRLFFDGSTHLQLANYLLMLSIMAESGATSDRIELFILDAQKLPRVPDGDPVWTCPAEAFSARPEPRVAIQPQAFSVPDFALREPVIVAPSAEPRPPRVEMDEQALLAVETGKAGEALAYRYFAGLRGESMVRWVNRERESGLPYDIVVGEVETNTVEYVEVKSTRYASKDWFKISPNEWQFALEAGDRFSVAVVHVAPNDSPPQVTIFKNPARLCQQGNLHLVLMQQRHQQQRRDSHCN